MKSKKELKDEYKQKKLKMGVFQIKNIINSKIFIGSSLDLDAIWNRHKSQLQFRSHPNKELQKDWNEFGEENFTYAILAEIKQDEDKQIDYSKAVKELEDLYIDELQPYDDRGYNRKIIKRQD